MTPEQEYEEAVEIVAKRLQAATQCGLWETCSAKVKRLRLNEARSLLRLTWPSGQRVLAVLASNQAMPETAYTAALEPDTWERIQSDLRTEGFRRVVQEKPSCPELKQEAKK